MSNKRFAAVMYAAMVFLTPELAARAAEDSLPTAREVGAIGDGKADDTAAIQTGIDAGKGGLRFERGVYRITETIEIDTTKVGFTSIVGEGNARIVMEGAGPAFRILGSHNGSADPASVKDPTWRNERMPVVSGIEIVGAHAEADGIELRKTIHAIIARVSVRKARHGIHLVERNRNVIITGCHLYENSGAGVFLDYVDLHQCLIGDTHVSYNKAGGVVVLHGGVRNLHVGNCDLESNMSAEHPRSANFLIDQTPLVPSIRRVGNTVAEISITGGTLQHRGGLSNGANIRILGRPDYPVNNVAISANVISDVALSVDLEHVKALSLVGNQFFVPRPLDVRARNCSQITLSGNQFDPRDYEGRDDQKGGVVFENCTDIILSGEQFHSITNMEGALVFQNCERFNVSGSIFRKCAGGILIDSCRDSMLHGCILSDTKITTKNGTNVQTEENLKAESGADSPGK